MYQNCLIPAEYLEITFLEEQVNNKKYTKLQREQTLPFAATGVFNAKLLSCSELSDGNNVKKVVEVLVDIKDSNFKYEPGCTVGILPKNNPNEVLEIIERLNYIKYADKLFIVSTKDMNTSKKFQIPPHVPVIGTIRDMLLNNLDIRSVPKKTFIRAISKYAENLEEANDMMMLCNEENAAKYSRLVSQFVPLLELLKEFSSCYPPFNVLLEHLPRLYPRPYSITSSPLQFDPPSSQLQFIYSYTILPKNYVGVCTGWLENSVKCLNFEKKIPLYMRQTNNFILPKESNVNIIMIANGTGIAPFMSFLRHKAIKSSKHKSKSEIWLFYGCRYSNKDFLFKSEIENYVNIGIIAKLFTTFSRECVKNKYIQDKISMHAESFIEMLFKNTVLYLCGRRLMIKQVYDTIIQCLRKVKKMSVKEAESLILHMKKNNKYIEDIWN